MTSVRYSCKTLKTSKMNVNDIVILVTWRLTVTIDFNGSMLVKKTITHRKGPSKEMGLDKIVRSGSGLAGIDRRDYGFDKKFSSASRDWRTLLGTSLLCTLIISQRSPCSANLSRNFYVRKRIERNICKQGNPLPEVCISEASTSHQLICINRQRNLK